MATVDEFLRSLRKEFGEQEAGRKFEIFCKWFLENDPEWSRAIDKVWLWDEYPNKWQRQDLGTDLVARDKEGLIWAVQAKCYAEHRSITKGDMNSFLADTGRLEVDRRLWLQTTNKIEAKAEKTFKGQEKPVTVFTLNDFRDAQIDYPSTFAELTKAKVKEKPTPDLHQMAAITDVVSGLEKFDRGQLIMACGTGKTLTTLWIKEARKAETTLVLLPSLSLLSQTMREWAWAGSTDFAILNVCSDKSVGKKTEDMDPTDAAFRVTSNINDIRAFLKRPEPKVVFCTYQSADLISQAQLDEVVPGFDLAIADEAHRCAGKANSSFATILDGSKILATKRLFTTATPRFAGKSVKDAGKVRDLAVVGMDDETVFGPVLHKLTFGQAIDYKPEPLLNDFQVVIVGVDQPMVREWITNYEIVATDPDKHTDARTLAAKIGLIKAVKDYDLQRVISFHSRVKGAKEFSDEMTSVLELVEPKNRPDGEFLSDYVSGTMAAGDRKEKIDRLKRLEGYDWGILTNARCLAEGVDVPSLDGIAFIDPKSSQIDIIQAVGRAIRKVRGEATQKKGTIILPVFIEDGDDHEASIEASNFKPVWDVLKALRAHDEVLSDELDQYRTNMAKNAGQPETFISDKILFDLPLTIDAQFSAALRSMLVEATTASWEFWFGLLEVFKKTTGHCRVSNSFRTENGHSLGHWVANQRFQVDTLSPARFTRLNEIGFIWDPLAEKWEQGFKELLKFKDKTGHCSVPGSFKTEGGLKLGIWVGTQRRMADTLSAERIASLNEIGFIWDPFAEKWEKGFNELLKFKDKTGHCSVPQTFISDSGFKLGSWVTLQRQKAESLSGERIASLNEIGFIWDPITEQWEQGFDELLKFKDKTGHCRVPTTFISEGGLALGNWVSNQRTKAESLSLERFTRLNEIGFIWDPITEQWEQGFDELLKFKDKTGHCRVPTIFISEGGFKLGNWVSNQRSKAESLSEERTARLNQIGFIWDLLSEQWEQGFNELLKFKGKTGHCRVKKTFISDSGFKLGSWVTLQRQKAESLSGERIASLNEIGFIWDPITEQWEQGFDELLKFKDKTGHCRVPTTFISEGGLALGNWVNNQRTKAESLSLERFTRLNEVGFIWDRLAEQWEQGFDELLKFKDKTGHCSVPATFKSDSGFKLGSWVSNQRTKAESLSLERFTRLNEVGFIWDRLAEKWEQGLKELLKFKDKTGHCSVPGSFKTEGGFKLGNWVGTQRRTADTLSAERIARLNEIGFLWKHR